MVDSPWLRVPEAAAYARRHENTITSALRDGSLRGNQATPRGHWLIHRDDLDAWIRGEVATSAPKPITRRRAS